LRSFGRGDQTPALKCLAGRSHGVVDIALIRALEDSDDIPGVGGVKVFVRLAAAGLHPLAADQVLIDFCGHSYWGSAFRGIKLSIVPSFWQETKAPVPATKKLF